MKKKEKDDHFATRIPVVLQIHETMLADGLRNKLLYEAIQKSVNENTSFLDIGAGTGVWAILAAKLGAKRVVAVEVEESLIPVIFKLAQENGVADKIQIIHGNSNHVKIRGKFDVIVSELFSTDTFGKETVASFVDLKKRFLAPNGILIPHKLALYAVPAYVEKPIQEFPADLPIKCEFLRSLKLNYSQQILMPERSGTRFLAEPKKLLEIDFQTLETAPSLSNLNSSWDMEDLSEANAIVIFNRSTFTEDIEMDSFGSQSWRVGTYAFVPFEKNSGVLKFVLTLDQKKENWTVSLSSDGSVISQSYSPIFAFTRMRMAQQMTPHKKFSEPKTKAKKKLLR